MIVPDEDIVCVVASETASDQASQPVSQSAASDYAYRRCLTS